MVTTTNQTKPDKAVTLRNFHKHAEFEPLSETVYIRLSRSQKEALQSRAQSVGYSISEYCRTILLGYEPKPKTPEEREWRLNVIRLSNNLNQVARKMNAYGADKKSIGEVLELINQINR